MIEKNMIKYYGVVKFRFQGKGKELKADGFSRGVVVEPPDIRSKPSFGPFFA